MTDAYVQARRRSGELTPRDALRQGLCPICKVVPADTMEDGTPWTPRGPYELSCCCYPCWESHGDYRCAGCPVEGAHDEKAL